MAPDPTSIIFWLKNRMPADWRSKIEAENKEALEKLDSILNEVRDNAVKQDAE